MLNLMTAFSTTLSVVLLLDNVMPRRSYSSTQFIGMFFKIQRSRIYTLTALNSMSCVNAKLSHFSNISTILALDGANSSIAQSIARWTLNFERAVGGSILTRVKIESKNLNVTIRAIN